jgi:hypothetical protein
MNKPCICIKNLKQVRDVDAELKTERGKLFMIIDHYPSCGEYPSALDAAVKMANDYPRLQSDFDDAMSMLKVANDALMWVRNDLSLTFGHISRTLNGTTDLTRTDSIEDHNKYVAQPKPDKKALGELVMAGMEKHLGVRFVDVTNQVCVCDRPPDDCDRDCPVHGDGINPVILSE